MWTLVKYLGLGPLGFKFASLLTIRGVLGLLYVYGMALFRRSFSQWYYGRQDGLFAGIWTAVVATQFHLNFYASRTLPNTFALILVLVGYHFWFQSKRVHTVAVFTFVSIVFRSELAILFAPMLIDLIFNNSPPSLQTTPLPASTTSSSPIIRRFLTLFVAGLIALAVSLVLTIGVDSFFWERLLWPEGELLYFNTVLNKSHEYGTSPFHWYFTSALPKAMACSFLFVPLGLLLLSKQGWFKVAPVFVFLVLYSFLPHKELRFVFYALPMLSAVATIAIRRLADLNGYRKVFFYAAILIVLSSIIPSAFLAFVSHHNYPGGDALNKIHHLADQGDRAFKVHLDAAPCQTGFSRFLEAHPKVQYYKTEGLTSFNNFTHRITDRQSASKGDREPLTEIIDSLTWKTVDTIHAFSGVSIKSSWPFLKLEFAPAMFIYERKL